MKAVAVFLGFVLSIINSIVAGFVIYVMAKVALRKDSGVRRDMLAVLVTLAVIAGFAALTKALDRFDIAFVALVVLSFVSYMSVRVVELIVGRAAIRRLE